MWRRYLCELAVREEAGDELDNDLRDIALERVMLTGTGSDSRDCHQLDVVHERVEDGPDVGLREYLLGLVFGVDVAVIEEADVGALDIDEAGATRDHLVDVLEREDRVALDLGEGVFAHGAADEHFDELNVEEEVTMHGGRRVGVFVTTAAAERVDTRRKGRYALHDETQLVDVRLVGAEVHNVRVHEFADD